MNSHLSLAARLLAMNGRWGRAMAVAGGCSLLLLSACDVYHPEAFDRYDAGEDAGSLDAGSLDAGSPDSGLLDAGSLDAGSPDSGLLDSSVADAGVGDAAPDPDAGAAGDAG